MNPILVIGLIAAWVVILVVCWLGWQLLRQNGRVLVRLEALEKRLGQSESGDENKPAMLPIGTAAPHFELPDLAGNSKSLADFLGRPVLLIFFNPACGFCRDLAPKLREKAESGKQKAGMEIGGRSERPLVLILSTGDAEQNRQFFAAHEIGFPVLLQKDGEVEEAFRANGTPSGYLINRAGQIASLLAMGGEALLAMADGETESGKQKAGMDQSAAANANGDGRENRFRERSVSRSKLKRDGLKAGTPAPEFRLPLLSGGELSLTELRGQPVFLVFSSPHCGPCNTLAPELERFHRKHPELKVVMIGRGEPGENQEKVQEHGLTFPVVLQKQWEISLKYAIFASPVAYLIDDEGVVTADVAVGVEPILELMTRAGPLVRQISATEKTPLLKRMARRPVAWTSAAFGWLLTRVTLAKTGVETFELKHFKFVPRADDIFIVTYPRSGTTWMQMILYQLTTDGSMGISHIAEHSPWFEHSGESDRGYEERAARRVFKSHLSFAKIPKGPGRYIYVARDGRDVAVSYYHLYRSHNGYKGTFAEFFELFMQGKVMWGSWFAHVGGWWKHRHQLNVLFLTYEELVADLEGCLRRIIAFCHLPVPPERLPLIVERCSFAFMKQHEDKFDPAVEALRQQGAKLNLFVRAGRVGDGVRQLNPEQQARFEQAFREHSEPLASVWPAPGPTGGSRGEVPGRDASFVPAQLAQR